MKEFKNYYCPLYRNRDVSIVRDYKKLKKEIAEDFKETMKHFMKKYPYIKSINFRSDDPWGSRGVIYPNRRLTIEVIPEDIEID